MISTVLVVDDDVTLRMAIAEAFAGFGYTTQTAANGREAMKLSVVEPADLVITDIFMPVKDGIELIIELGQFLHVPKIIAISGGGMARGKPTLEMAKLLGADAVMPKPLNMDTLVRLGRRLMEDRADELMRSWREPPKDPRAAA
jgi:CheY-like chemotaxis protein